MKIDGILISEDIGNNSFTFGSIFFFVFVRQNTFEIPFMVSNISSDIIIMMFQIQSFVTLAWKNVDLEGRILLPKT